jgi:hypothetical protein
MASSKDGYSHCFFKRQPTNPAEVERAIKAMEVSCVENIRYDGSDPRISKKLSGQGLGHLCDPVDGDSG